jgi:UDP-2,3-diacylglucosamine pyrophosphatase LpxH
LAVLGRLKDLKPEFLVLNGDIFDFCFGSSNYFKKKFQEVGILLTAIGQNGTKVIFVQGNHEFSIEDIGWEEVTFVVAFDHHLTLKSGLKFSITHGDRLMAPWQYGVYWKVTRSKIFKWGGLCLPGRWLDQFALAVAAKSRSRDAYRSIDHAGLKAAAAAWMEQGQGEHGIIGHFHFPYAETLPGGKGLLLSVKSWDEPNLLLFDQDAGFYRVYPKLGGPWKSEAVNQSIG